MHRIEALTSTNDHNAEAFPHLFNSGSRKTITETFRHHAIKQAIHMMRAHFQDPLTLQEMADAAQLSSFHFNRIFRSITGTPPSVYLAALRIEQAKKLLLMTDQSVTSICFDVGYNSLGTFTTRFTQFVGVTPTQLRQISRNTMVSEYFHNWDCLQDMLDLMQSPSEKIIIEGTISAPASFRGLIFLGLFADPIPQGRPMSCTVLSAPGNYQLASVPDGQYYLFAVAIPRSEDFLGMLEARTSLRCSTSQFFQIQHNSPKKSLNLMLSPAYWTDPPILIALPGLLMSELFGSQSEL